METKRNLKYFTQKGLSVFIYISLGLLLVGVILLIVAGRNTALLMVGILFVLLGFGFLMFSSSGKSNELDIDAACQAMTKDLIELATKRFEVYERSYLRMIHPIEIRAYQFDDSPDLLTKKASDGQLRSNLFSGIYMFFTNDNVYIYQRIFSVTDESYLKDYDHKIPYAKMVGASVEEHPVQFEQGNKTREYKDYKFVITTTEGEVLRMSVAGGADIDKAVADINHVVDVKHKNPTDRLATEGGKYSNAKNF
ncbi:MAG: hypothetical protein II797_01540 [Clostridia bacterium]|nr:hypothetical protein [Clostridia bacterium]